jgi:hypothetical protein
MRTNRISGRVVWFAGALLTTLLTVVTINHAAAGKIYRCVDETTKKVTVSDAPCQYSAPASAKSDKEKAVEKAADADKKSADKKDAQSAK